MRTVKARRLSSGAIIVLLVAGSAGLFWLHYGNARLSRRIADLRRQSEQSTGARLQDRSTPALMLSAQNTPDRLPATDPELEQMRKEVAALEKLAQRKRAEKLAKQMARVSADAASVAGGGNPEVGLARLEVFQNVGFETPGNAFQTLVWAAIKGDDGVLGRALIVTGAARDRAEALIATLPENIGRDATPEKLAALWFARTALDVTAAQITGEIREDPTHVRLTVRGGFGTNGRIQMQLGPNGWQLVVPEQAMEGAQIKLLGTSLPKNNGRP